MNSTADALDTVANGVVTAGAVLVGVPAAVAFDFTVVPVAKALGSETEWFPATKSVANAILRIWS